MESAIQWKVSQTGPQHAASLTDGGAHRVTDRGCVRAARKPIIADVAVQSIVKVTRDVFVPVKKETVAEKIVDVRVACIRKDIHEGIMDIFQERICERTGELVDDGHVPRVTRGILEEIKDVPKERISELRNDSSGKLKRSVRLTGDQHCVNLACHHGG